MLPTFKHTVFFLIFIFFMQGSSLAKDYIVRAYNTYNGQDMVFEPGFIHIEKGDRVTFEIVDKNTSHNSQSIFTPDKATPWDSPENKNFTQTFDQEGVYIYQCSTHAVMSMLGIIQVGRAHNLTAAKKFIEQNRTQWPINPQRVDTYIKRVIP